jgi:hypothetical protein
MYMNSTDRTNQAMVVHDFPSERHHLAGRLMHIELSMHREAGIVAPRAIITPAMSCRACI